MEPQTKSPEVSVRYFDVERDYEEYASWQKAHGMTVTPKIVIPEVGIIAECDGVALAALLLFWDKTAHFGLPTFVVSNPVADKEARSIGIDMVLKEVVTVSKDLGIVMLWTATNHKMLGKRLENAGFRVTDQGSTEYAVVLGGE